jgi:hypothetical protein
MKMLIQKCIYKEILIQKCIYKEMYENINTYYYNINIICSNITQMDSMRKY